ncbi:MAG: hypothetical protein EA402_14335 [Planctomycetota bacterium]|nr:MAG: hypothetical protein EA402_14335 [Planctomycetota bacterium]
MIVDYRRVLTDAITPLVRQQWLEGAQPFTKEGRCELVARAGEGLDPECFEHLLAHGQRADWALVAGLIWEAGAAIRANANQIQGQLLQPTAKELAWLPSLDQVRELLTRAQQSAKGGGSARGLPWAAAADPVRNVEDGPSAEAVAAAAWVLRRPGGAERLRAGSKGDRPALDALVVGLTAECDDLLEALVDADRPQALAYATQLIVASGQAAPKRVPWSADKIALKAGSLLFMRRRRGYDEMPPSFAAGYGSSTPRPRQAAFARAVKARSSGCCALSGIREAVEAAHWKPNHLGGPEDPANGIALHRPLHRSQERGEWTLADDGTILARPQAPAVVRAFAGRCPPGAADPDAIAAARPWLAWHRRHHGWD